MPHHVTYQIICFEPAGLGRIEALQNVIRQRFADLDFDVETAVTFLSYSQVEQCDQRSPTVGVYFGSATTADDATRGRIKDLLDSAVTVVPVVDDLTNYQSLVPAELYPINGLQFDAAAPNYETIAARLLEELHLLRETRRLFISYRRSESRDVAIQLYEALDGKGFDVFLDTVSIRPGEDFQKMLHYRLADVDVIVLLHTMGFMERRWTVEELTNANRLNIAILRLEWPEIAAWRKDAEARNDQPELAKIRQLDEQASLSEPFILTDRQFTATKTLLPTVCAIVAEQTEGLRARALAARQTSLTKEFARQARDVGFEVLPQPEHYLLLRKPEQVDRIAVPVVGAPSALIYEALYKRIKALPDTPSTRAYIVYDHRALLERHLEHLAWLDGEMQSVHSIRVADARQVLGGLR
jgi:hypothetical protein